MPAKGSLKPMATLKFPSRWPPSDPDRIQLYSMNTANGQKVSICLEEMGLEYEAHRVDFWKGEQHDADYLLINPNGKIPSLIDPQGPENKAIALMESIVILVYLADKTGMLLPQDSLARLEHLQWLSFQAAHIGPMFGQFGHFYIYAKDKTNDSYALERYSKETRRLLQVLENRLEDREYIMDEFSIVDIAIQPWVLRLTDFYHAAQQLNITEFERVLNWQNRLAARAGFKTGKEVCGA